MIGSAESLIETEIGNDQTVLAGGRILLEFLVDPSAGCTHACDRTDRVSTGISVLKRGEFNDVRLQGVRIHHQPDPFADRIRMGDRSGLRVQGRIVIPQHDLFGKRVGGDYIYCLRLGKKWQ